MFQFIRVGETQRSDVVSRLSLPLEQGWTCFLYRASLERATGTSGTGAVARECFSSGKARVLRSSAARSLRTLLENSQPRPGGKPDAASDAKVDSNRGAETAFRENRERRPSSNISLEKSRPRPGGKLDAASDAKADSNRGAKTTSGE